MKWTTCIRWIVLIVCCLSMSACHYYQDYRQKKGNADVTEERAALMKSYRECLDKYKDDAAVTQERCGAYKDMLRRMDVGANP